MKRMKLNLLTILILSVFTSIQGQEYSKKELNRKPVNLTEAVEQLNKIHHDTTKQKIFDMTEDELIAGAHMGLGLWMRNTWGLWKRKKLAKHFNSMGIYHPDDMSGIILETYYRELHGREWKVEEQVEEYQTYWKNIKNNDQANE